MRILMALIAAGILASACTTSENLRPAEKGEFLALKNVTYEQVWQAANKVMARRLKITESDSELGRIKGVSGDYKLFWSEAVGLFVWPTESNDFGYTVDVDATDGLQSGPVDTKWRQLLLTDLKKELGAS